jgi:hypothetical protein
VDLQADEPARVRLADRVIDDVVDRLAVDPGLNPRSVGDDAQFVPAVVDEVRVAVPIFGGDVSQFVPIASP